mgnify:FL=1
MQIFSLIIKGGYVMYPIILCSIISLAIFLERWYVLRHSKERVERYLRSVKRAVAQKDWESVVDISKKNQSPPSRIILAGVRKYFQGLNREAREAMEDIAMQELPVYEKRLSTLSVVASISPLLGLLGTVTGMIRTFNVISVVGVGKPAEMAGGISEALITTAAGLIVAIPTVLAHHYLSNLADEIINDIDRACTEVVEALEESANSHNALPLEDKNLWEGEEENVPISVSEKETNS